jgi:hypothetical protein
MNAQSLQDLPIAPVRVPELILSSVNEAHREKALSPMISIEATMSVRTSDPEPGPSIF